MIINRATPVDMLAVGDQIINDGAVRKIAKIESACGSWTVYRTLTFEDGTYSVRSNHDVVTSVYERADVDRTKTVMVLDTAYRTVQVINGAGQTVQTHSGVFYDAMEDLATGIWTDPLAEVVSS